MDEYTPNGILYTWELAGSQGAAFTLFPSDNNSPKQIKEAKQYIRDNRDAISIRIANDDDRDYLYKSEYFRHPLCRPLKWYQIEQDEKLIRSERKKGTTPDEFVERFVIPFTERTERNFLSTHREGIYNI